MVEIIETMFHHLEVVLEAMYDQPKELEELQIGQANHH